MDKEITRLFKNLKAFDFLVGMSFGAAVGLVLFCYLVPHGPKAISMLRHYSQYTQTLKNKKVFGKMDASSTLHAGMRNDAMDMGGINPYMMSSITSEKQFLHDMELHHESAVLMAQQVLTLKSLHQEVEKLANDILNAQTKEIADMKAWGAKWGY